MLLIMQIMQEATFTIWKSMLCPSSLKNLQLVVKREKQKPGLITQKVTNIC
ncbi:hypothetical protein Goklo_022151, partial [Gossypium klotzschianum]|nr:hypothetical protein [Gossypium klotzschianum]